MDFSKCVVVVIAPEDAAPPDKLNPPAMFALVKARESHIKYRTAISFAIWQLIITWAFCTSAPTTVLLSILGVGLFTAARMGVASWFWKRRFHKAIG